MTKTHNRPDRPGHFRVRPLGNSDQRLAALLKRFLGREVTPTEEHFDTYAALCWEGDDLADPVADWYRQVGPGVARPMIQTALDHGIEAVAQAPAVLRAFFAQAERVPHWLDRDLLDVGAKAIHRAGPLAIFVLGDLALIGGYAGSAAMNQSLVFTGALQEGSAQRRLYETGKWWLDVTASGGLDRFAPGFKSAVHVRLMHALVRGRLRNHRDWDYDFWGEPISQAHMLSTNNAFCTLFLLTTQTLGMRYSARERLGIMHLWRYLAVLNGVDGKYAHESLAEGVRILWMSLRSQPKDDPHAASLAAGALNTQTPLPGLPAGLDGPVAALVKRYRMGLTAMLGKGTLKKLGYPVDQPWIYSAAASMAVMGGAEIVQRLVPGGPARAAAWGRRAQEAMIAANGAGGAEFQPVKDLVPDRAPSIA